MYQGHVYDKQTRNPLSGLRVSDGLNIAVTDDLGAFSLPGWEKAHVISVQCLTKAHDDWYYRIEEHTGDYDFYITPAAAEADHRFFQISDTEIDCVGEADIWLPFVKKQIAANPAAFLIQTGDICRIEGLSSHYLAMNYDVLGIPVRFCMGNHDYVDDRYGDYSFERFYGPSWYSFDLGNTHYIVLPMRGGDAPSAYTQDDINRWLYNDMQAKDPAKSLVLFCHTHAPYEDTYVYEVDDKKFDLRDYGFLAWVFGHYHINWVTDLGGYYNICTSRPDCGGIDSSPTAIRSIEIFGDHTLKTKLHYNDLTLAAPADTNAVWERALPGHVMYAAPILENGKLYISTCCDEIPFDAGLYCLNPDNGDILWSYKPHAGFKNVPSIDNGILYAQDTFGWVYALKADTGELVWKQLVPVYWGHHAENGVLAAEGKVFCGCGRRVVAVSQKDGAILWTGEPSVSSEDCPARFVLAHDNGRSILLACRQWRHIYALDAETGETLWRNAEPRTFAGTPLVIGDFIYLHAIKHLYKLRLSDGEIVQKFSPDEKVNFNTAMQSVLRDGILYSGTADRGMIASDINTFETVRTYTVKSSICPMAPYQRHTAHECQSAPLFSGDNILFTSPDGYLHICNTETTEEVRALSLGAPCYVAPVLWKNTVICADFCGHVRAFAL